uniref:hypothetical protein n=1 Tax=Hydrogenophaga sp. OTU3427 TaxID=3043856 RepID=UPI00313CDE90
YRDRIFVVLDAVHSAGLPDQLVAMGIPKENVIVWPKNGIEYYYPPAVVDKVFGVGPEITISGDVISRNGLSYSKGELVGKVVSLLQPDTAMHEEFETRFLRPLAAQVG